MEWDLTNTTGFIAGVVGIAVGIIIIAWPRALAIIVGLYLILIGALSIVNAID